MSADPDHRPPTVVKGDSGTAIIVGALVAAALVVGGAFLLSGPPPPTGPTVNDDVATEPEDNLTDNTPDAPPPQPTPVGAETPLATVEAYLAAWRRNDAPGMLRCVTAESQLRETQSPAHRNRLNGIAPIAHTIVESEQAGGFASVVVGVTLSTGGQLRLTLDLQQTEGGWLIVHP